MSKLKDKSSLFIVAGLLVIIIVTAIFVILPMFQPSVTVRLGDGVFTARVANTTTQREKGLSDVMEFSGSQALLMVFASNGQWKIWMKDMKIPIDIVWLDQSKKVIYIIPSASPDGGTDTIYTPPSDARFVMELPAGVVATQHIRLGLKATFDVNMGDAR
jgi:uncharacterized membrane protein (UPF0127 family)